MKTFRQNQIEQLLELEKDVDKREKQGFGDFWVFGGGLRKERKFIKEAKERMKITDDELHLSLKVEP